jgi:hypothetical protein
VRAFLLAIFIFSLISCSPAPDISPPTGTIPSPAAFYPSQAATIQQTQGAPGSAVQVFIRRVERSGKEAQAEVCFISPDPGDWTIGSVHFLIGEAEMPFAGSTLTDLKPLGAALQRCELLTFLVPPEMEVSSAILQVDHLQLEPGTEELCTLYLPKLRPRLEAQGIQADCLQTAEGWKVRLLSHPPQLSPEQAEALIYDPANFAVSGPWRFTLQFQP